MFAFQFAPKTYSTRTTSSMVPDVYIKYFGPWEIGKSKLSRKVLRFLFSSKVNFAFLLQIRDYLFCRSFTQLKKDEVYMIVVNSHYFNLINERVKNYLHLHTKKCYFVLSFSDTVEYFENNYKGFPSIDELKTVYDMIISYNVVDVKKYDLILTPPSFPEEFYYRREHPSTFTSDVFFVGRNKNRIDLIHHIYRCCRNAGLICDFTIIDVDKDEMDLKSEISYNTFLPYNEVITRIQGTKCVVNLVQDGSSGISLRDYEAFAYDKFLITNNYYLKETDLYDDRQVIWVDELDDRLSEIQTGFCSNRNLLSMYDPAHWFNNLFNLLSDNSVLEESGL